MFLFSHPSPLLIPKFLLHPVSYDARYPLGSQQQPKCFRYQAPPNIESKEGGSDDVPVVSSRPMGERENAAAGQAGRGKASGYDHDRTDMRRMGKKQKLRRNFRMISTIGFTTCVMGTWEILLTANTQGLTAGGLAGLFWSVVWCYTGQFFVVMSLAEMASMAPTAGGQYHWVSEFAPRSWQRFLSYCSGWLSKISWQSIIAIDSFIIGNLIQALVVVNDIHYTESRWQGTLLTIASVLGIAAFNVFAAKRLPLAEGIFALVHVFAFVPVVVCLWVLTPTKQTATAFFAQFTDNGAAWPSLAESLMVGQVHRTSTESLLQIQER
ncbi:hypothetical protein LTR91_018708 [Friedmanniomyces endolithicus]|uniref:Amino acid permease/ SLC12A domain-containing protein n=1 Tax=Friedmanniomyces endolithicus TaxID=329885 RepID=A0AAN6K583_9PEZI|nr:hypothetical protein LTR91_018708 [Friedmanniomyces endolithicus]